MKHRVGFTLVEVLVVVVIAVSVTAFAVPLYKKTQERNRFLAAQGILMDLSTALQSLRADFISVDRTDGATAPAAPAPLTSDHQTSSKSDYQKAQNATSLADDSNVTVARVPYALFARDYMQPIPYDSGSSYKGYQYYICPATLHTQTNHCCHLSTVACMKKKSGCAATTSADFQGAYVNEGGLVVPVDKSSTDEEKKSTCAISY